MKNEVNSLYSRMGDPPRRGQQEIEGLAHFKTYHRHLKLASDTLIRL